MKYKFALTAIVAVFSFSSASNVVSDTKVDLNANAKPVAVENQLPSPELSAVSTPLIQIDDQASKQNQLSNWCSLRDSDEVSIVNDEYSFYGFVTSKGSLNSNMQSLLKSFYPANQKFIDKTQRHKVLSNVCILSRNKQEVIQRLIEPYRFNKQPIIFGTFANEIAVMFYRNDAEMASYLRVR